MASSAVTRSLVRDLSNFSLSVRIKGASDATVADHYGTGSKAGMGQSGGRGMGGRGMGQGMGRGMGGRGMGQGGRGRGQ